MIIGICKRCGFAIKFGEWFATTHLHFFCATSKDLRILGEEAKKRNEEIHINRGMGSHFGGRYAGWCLEI